MNKESIANKVSEQPKKETQLPYLITRMGAGLLDLAMIILVFFALQLGAFHTIYYPLGYHQALNEAREILKESHLFIVAEDNSYNSIIEFYDNEMRPEDYYEPPLMNFYLTNERAQNADLFTTYEASKISSGLFVFDDEGNIVIKDMDRRENLKTFYERQVTNAINFLEKDPVYVAKSKQVFLITVFTYLIGGTFVFALFYLFVPLLNKDRATLSQLLFKIGLANTKTNTKATRKQSFIRFLILLLINLWMPLLIYARWSYFTFAPILITLILIVVTRKNQSIHCMISHTRLLSTRNQPIPVHAEIIEEVQP